MDARQGSGVGRQGSGIGRRVYEDIVPSHDMTQGDKADTLIIDVTGFRKEQIKVLIDNYGKLRVNGERPVGENKWVRFRKDFQTPENCNTAEIRAKFENGRVLITLPKFVVDPVLPFDANGQKKEETRTEPPPVDAQNKAQDKEADKSDKDSESTSDTYSDAESTEQPLSTRFQAFKQKALESVYGSRKTICSTFAVIVISVGVGLIISSKLFEQTPGGGNTDLVALIAP